MEEDIELISKKKAKRIQWFNKMLTIRLGIKTKALWYSAQVIQQNLQPDKTIDEVYEMLKFMGKQQYKKDKPEMAKYVK